MTYNKHDKTVAQFKVIGFLGLLQMKEICFCSPPCVKEMVVDDGSD